MPLGPETSELGGATGRSRRSITMQWRRTEPEPSRVVGTFVGTCDAWSPGLLVIKEPRGHGSSRRDTSCESQHSVPRSPARESYPETFLGDRKTLGWSRSHPTNRHTAPKALIVVVDGNRPRDGQCGPADGQFH